MADDVARLDLSGRIVASNGGVAAGNSLGDSVFGHLPPAQADAVRQLMTAAHRPDHVEVVDQLAIRRTIIQQYGGRRRATPSIGSGLTLRFLLRLASGKIEGQRV
jgi:hypothetical protein